jgi:hypothetical protein
MVRSSSHGRARRAVTTKSPGRSTSTRNSLTWRHRAQCRVRGYGVVRSSWIIGESQTARAQKALSCNGYDLAAAACI